jgi:hypothetical protein
VRGLARFCPWSPSQARLHQAGAFGTQLMSVDGTLNLTKLSPFIAQWALQCFVVYDVETYDFPISSY